MNEHADTVTDEHVDTAMNEHADEAMSTHADAATDEHADTAMNEHSDTVARTSAEKKPPRLFSLVFVSITAVVLCGYLTGQGLNAGTSVYIDRLDGSATLAGIGAAAFSFAAIVGRLFAGPFSDSIGRLKVFAAGAVVLLAGVLGAAFSASLDYLMLWRILQGIGFAAITTATATAAADVLPAERLGEGIGYFGLGQALAMSVGPALAIALVSTNPPENLFWGLSIPPALAIVLCLFCRYEKNPEKLPETSTYRRLAMAEDRDSGSTENDEPDGEPAGASAGEPAGKSAGASAGEPAGKQASWLSKIVEPGALAGGIPLMVLSPAFGFGIYFVGLLGTKLGMANAGLFYTLSAVSMIVVRVSSKAFMDKALPIKLFGLAVLSGVIGFMMLLVVTLPSITGVAQSALFYGAGIFYGLCMGIALPVNQTVAVKNSPPERWGAANGLFMLLFDIGIGLASVIWGITNDCLGFTYTIAFVIVCAVASLGAAHLTYPPSAKQDAA